MRRHAKASGFFRKSRRHSYRPVEGAILLSPLARALAQLDDPVFLGVLLRSVAWSVRASSLLHIATIWGVHQLLDLHGWLGWAADVLGGIGASLLALWLFLPVAAIIGTLYIDRIARAVERRHYPTLPPPRGASARRAAVGRASASPARILLLNVLALVPRWSCLGSALSSPGSSAAMPSAAACSPRWRCAGCRGPQPRHCTAAPAPSSWRRAASWRWLDMSRCSTC